MSDGRVVFCKQCLEWGCGKCEPPPVPLAKVIELDDYREVEDIVKRRFKAKHCIFSTELETGEILSYIPDELLDITLVYMIQTLKDRRARRVDEINS